jgi:hypothetical protein
MLTLIVGDTHAEWGILNAAINKHHPDQVIVCGDFGFWPGEKGYELAKIKPQYSNILFCDGNHENHPELRKLGDYKQPIPVAKNIWWMPRGFTLRHPQLGTVLFMGGAESMDKHVRTPGRDWFPEESISQEDIYSLPDTKIDTVISHTCPMEFTMLATEREPSRVALSEVLRKYKPSRWFFGHWHHYKEDRYQDCSWISLDCSTGQNWILKVRS